MGTAPVAQVVDRSASPRLRVESRSGSGLEALLALFVLNESVPLERYEKVEIVRELLKRRLPAAVDRAIRRLKTPAGDPWLALLGVAATAQPPYDLATLADRLQRLQPVDLKAALLGLHQRPSRSANGLDATVIRGAADGDRTAVADLLRIGRTEGWEAEVAPLLRIPAQAMTALVVDAIEAVPAELFLDRSSPGNLLERNAFEANRLLAGVDDVETVINQLARGGVYKAEPGITTAILIPSLVHRPLTLVLNHDETKLVCYPARLDEELSAPAGGLVGLYRALGDGTRLRILRRLATGTATVGRISEELGLAKSTVHAHLLSLRIAGLVRLPGGGGFELAPELPDLNWMLKEFLGLEMRNRCETCGTPLEPDGEAYICSYECTFCPNCSIQHGHLCPNCQGELVTRPKRDVSRQARGGLSTGQRRPHSRTRK